MLLASGPPGADDDCVLFAVEDDAKILPTWRAARELVARDIRIADSLVRHAHGAQCGAGGAGGAGGVGTRQRHGHGDGADPLDVDSDMDMWMVLNHSTSTWTWRCCSTTRRRHGHGDGADPLALTKSTSCDIKPQRGLEPSACVHTIIANTLPNQHLVTLSRSAARSPLRPYNNSKHIAKSTSCDIKPQHHCTLCTQSMYERLSFLLLFYPVLQYFKFFLRSARVLECWSAGLLECWSARVLECWSVGVLECWSAGVLECWSARVSAGVLQCWSAGALECWSARVLECWSVGVLEC
jgi:hypothetical protein